MVATREEDDDDGGGALAAGRGGGGGGGGALDDDGNGGSGGGGAAEDKEDEDGLLDADGEGGMVRWKGGSKIASEPVSAAVVSRNVATGFDDEDKFESDEDRFSLVTRLLERDLEVLFEEESVFDDDDDEPNEKKEEMVDSAELSASNRCLSTQGSSPELSCLSNESEKYEASISASEENAERLPLLGEAEREEVEAGFLRGTLNPDVDELEVDDGGKDLEFELEVKASSPERGQEVLDFTEDDDVVVVGEGLDDAETNPERNENEELESDEAEASAGAP